MSHDRAEMIRVGDSLGISSIGAQLVVVSGS